MFLEEKVIIGVMVALVVAGAWLFVENTKERESLYQECLSENVLSQFECKAAAREMTRINH